jgi:cell wall-associated NlpC family hydrolase
MLVAMITLLTLLSINFGTGSGQARVSKSESLTATYDLRTTLLNFGKEVKQKQKRLKLKQVVEYLTTRVHKTGYVFSGSTIAGWDCSGMVRYAYQRMNIELPHSANKQGHVGQRVSIPRVGDIVVFAHQGSTDFYHSAIYVGSGLIINANRLYKTTVIQPLTDFKKSQIRFVRVIQ